MSDRKLVRVRLRVAGVLIAFGIIVIALGISGIHFTRDHLKQEGIVFGPASDPAVAEHAEQWAGEPVERGSRHWHSRTSCASTRSAARAA